MNEQNDQIESGGVAGPIGSPTPDQQEPRSIEELREVAAATGTPWDPITVRRDELAALIAQLPIPQGDDE